MDTELTFKALADPSRRTLLDQLFARDGQTLTELEAHLDMSRFGVMKHLKLLEEAGLITTEKRGREKYHFLNPVPIQLVYDRWVQKYARPITSQLADLKYTLEETMNETITHKYQIFIQTVPEKLWDALTNGTISPSYYFGCSISSDWEDGNPYTIGTDENLLVDGVNVEVDPPHKLVQTFNAHWHAEAKELGQSKVTWLIEPEGTACKLTLIHEELKDFPFAEGIIEGWSRILSGLKTVLETGDSMVFA